MSRKSLLLGLAIAALLLSGVGTVLAFMVRYEPGVYQHQRLPPGHERDELAKAFNRECASLIDGVVNKRQWSARFTNEQINCYFVEDFLRSENSVKVLPEGITDPRIAIEPDRIRLAFRYGTERWSTVISIELRVWLATRESNVILLELQGFKAGSLPISAQSLLDRIAESARAHNVELTWYRHSGNPTALVRLQPYASRPSFQLQQLELRQGELRISGRSTDPVPAAAVGPEATVSRVPDELEGRELP